MSMINKVLPCFYLIDVKGSAINEVISGEFGIDRIVLGSREFRSDLDAAKALEIALKFIVQNRDGVSDTVEFNPEYYPVNASSEVDAEIEELNEEAEELSKEFNAQNSGKIMSVLTRKFDPFGDFVISREKLESSDFQVEGRVVIIPSKYMEQKTIEQMLDMAKTPLEKAQTSNEMKIH